MSTVSRRDDSVVDDCPPLAPAEHAWVEGQLGRTLTAREAQDALKDAKLRASWEWEAKKKGIEP